jgi:hypothetical protein
MSELPFSIQSPSRAIDATLVALGFVQGDDGVLVTPSNSVVTLTPIGAFYELRISVDGNAVTAVLSKTALKICREGAR